MKQQSSAQESSVAAQSHFRRHLHTPRIRRSDAGWRTLWLWSLDTLVYRMLLSKAPVASRNWVPTFGGGEYRWLKKEKIWTCF